MMALNSWFNADVPLSNYSLTLLFDGLHPRNPYNFMDYYLFSNPKGMEGWIGLIGWLIANT